MAISKERKKEIVEQYTEWLDDSKAFFLAEYTGLTMKNMDELRSKIRDAGGEFHVVKNTLAKLAFSNAELTFEEKDFLQSTAIAFAFEDAPAMAKAVSEYAKDSDFLKIKRGYLDRIMMSAADVDALAKLPPLPVMRAKLLGTLLAPASQLVRTFAEPGRQVATVLKSFSEKDAAAEAA